MKATKRLVLFLVSCLTLVLSLCLCIAAEGEEEAKAGLSTGALVSLIIGGVLVLALIVLCIVKHEKVAAGFRSYKSEMKKITWYPWKQVWRNTVLVLVVVLATAVVVGLLDFAFFQGEAALVRAFGGQ